jgi:hypothetical protein
MEYLMEFLEITERHPIPRKPLLVRLDGVATLYPGDPGYEAEWYIANLEYTDLGMEPPFAPDTDQACGTCAN